MDYLISLFSQFSGNLNNTQTSTTPNGQPTIYEDQALTANASNLSDAESSTQPQNLSTNPQFQLSDQESTTQSEASLEIPRETPPSPTEGRNSPQGGSYDAPEVDYLSDDDSQSHNNTRVPRRSGGPILIFPPCRVNTLANFQGRFQVFPEVLSARNN